MRKKKEKEVEGFVKWELELFRNECNFTGDGMSFEEIAGQMGYCMTKINKLSESVTEKIIKVLPLKEVFFKKYRDKYGE